MTANLSRAYVLYISDRGTVLYFDQTNQPTVTPNGPWPLVSVNTRPEAESLLVLFCTRENPSDRNSLYFLPGFQGKVEDLSFATNRFIDGYDQMRNNNYVEYAPNLRNR